jgi:hypothetical protein
MEVVSHPNFNVDDQLAELRQLRARLAEILISSHALIGQTVDKPYQVDGQVRAAVKAIDIADSIVKARMDLLYGMHSTSILKTPPMAIASRKALTSSSQAPAVA